LQEAMRGIKKWLTVEGRDIGERGEGMWIRVRG
jgi:hypothetical protein